MDKAWVGVDAGKEFHWAHALDASGRELLSRKVENDEADLSKLIDDVLLVAEELVWAVDQPGGGAALLLALLWERNQRVLYVPGQILANLSQVRKRSPSCSFCSLADATSSPTRVEPSLASEKHFCHCFRLWSGLWISTARVR
jgi:hypothetical protein